MGKSVKKYPWEKWFGKSKFFLYRGRDYTCSTWTMIQQVRNAASARSLSLEIKETKLPCPGFIVHVLTPTHTR